MTDDAEYGQATEQTCPHCGDDLDELTNLETVETEPYCWNCGDFVEVSA